MGPALGCDDPRVPARASPSRPCCGGELGSATRRQRARHRGPLTGRPARHPLALAWGPRPSSLRIAPNGVTPNSPRRDSIPRCDVVAWRTGKWHARTTGEWGLIAGWGVGPRGPHGSIGARDAGRCASPKPREGRESAERPSVAGVRILRGVPMFAATARPRGDPTLRPGRSHPTHAPKATRPRAYSPGPRVPRSSQQTELLAHHALVLVSREQSRVTAGRDAHLDHPAVAVRVRVDQSRLAVEAAVDLDDFAGHRHVQL